jgi:hypothetical protein
MYAIRERAKEALDRMTELYGLIAESESIDGERGEEIESGLSAVAGLVEDLEVMTANYDLTETESD